MKSLWKHLWLTAASVALLLTPLAKAEAQIKPVAVVSIAHVDKLLGDIDYLAKTGGAADAGRLVTLMAGPYVAGLDRTKPGGAYVLMEGETPIVVGFVAVKDLTMVLATLKDSLGEPKDLGDGVQQVGEGPISVCIKQEGAFAFIAQDAKYLTNLPKDPIALLGGLEKTYSIAAKLNMKNLPQPLKEQAIKALQDGAAAAPADVDDPAQKELVEKLQANSIKQMKALVEETDEITIGWAVDGVKKSTYIDFVFTAIDGTKLARTMAGLKDSKTNYSGFLDAAAAFTMNLSSQSTDADEIAQAVALVESMRGTMLKELGKDEDLEDDEKAAATELIGTVVDVFKATLATGKADGGALALADEEELTFVAGGHVVDAAKLEAAIKKAVAFVQKKHPDELEDVEVEFDSGKHGGIRFHTISYTLDDENAEKVFGETLDVVIGFGDTSVYVAFGNEAEAALKKVIDQSAAAANKAVPPAQMNFALGPFMKFAASVEENPTTAMLAELADKFKGNDRIKINVKAISNGELMRFEVEEGVIQMIGEAAKNAQGPPGL
ncbi:MAG TPA: hypothetical protein VL096_02550 [Pirellulaceae bacterium]|nr:hypothetical protein [Pirellulaceae bacterium]